MFREGMPTKFKELVRNVRLDDWEQMLTKVKDKVATPRMVVDSALHDLDKIAVPKSDLAFVKFVEDLKLIIADLETLGLRQEVANSPVLLKLEKKLSENIAREWTKEVIHKKLDSLPPQKKFDAMLIFLEEQK